MATSTITELDLNVCYPNTITDRINAVPGLKTSTAFFTFLRANLVLPAMSSNVSTPILEPQTSPSASRSLGSLATNEPQTDLDDIPPLSLDVLTTKEDKVEALRLVADSIAQQRQQASLILVFHPLCLAGLALALAMVYQFAWVRRDKDLGIFLSMGSGVIMSYLMAIRYVASGYVQLAEQMTWDWVVSDDGEEDVLLGTKFGDEMIGALALRLEPSPSLTGNKKKGRGLSLKGGRGVIRAWTTKLRYRRRGVGGDMLHEAVRVTRERCGKDAEVGFAKEHANSVMLLSELFNGSFRKREMKAAKALEDVLSQWEGTKRLR